MTKIYKIIIMIIVGSFLILPTLIFADSGACSSHLGVNCLAGADSDGSVICNDGWRDSEVWYYSVDICKPICLSPITYGCTNQQDLENLSNYYANRGLAFSGTYNKARQDCSQQINTYNQQMREYDECYNDLLQWYEDANKQWEKDISNLLKEYSCPLNSIYDNLKEICVCNYGYVADGNKCISGDNYCWNKYGYDSNYNSLNKTCGCREGYIMNNSQCVSGDGYCKDKYDSTAYYSNGNCYHYLSNFDEPTPEGFVPGVLVDGTPALPPEGEVLGESTSNPLGIQSGWLIKNKKFVEVFYVDENLCLHWIINEDAAFKHFGDFWWQKIKDYDEISQPYKFCSNLE